MEITINFSTKKSVYSPLVSTKINQDIMFNILLNGNIDNLKILCQTNKIANQICNSDFFWMTKLSHDNIPVIYKKHPNNYIKWVEYYKCTRDTLLKIDNILNIVLNVESLDSTIILCSMSSICDNYKILHLLPRSLYNQLTDIIKDIDDELSVHQDFKIKILDDNTYEISCTVFLYDRDVDISGDDITLTTICNKKDIIYSLTKILYLHPDMNIIDMEGYSYIHKYLDKDMNLVSMLGKNSIRHERLSKRLK